MTIKAIQTRYKGYHFRSRLEARWAVFLDALSLRWEYEKEGFNLDGLLYLPDFWLPAQRCWLEIKPEVKARYKWDEAKRFYQPSECPRSPQAQQSVYEDLTKCRRLAESSGFPVFMLFGDLCDLSFCRTTEPTADDPGDGYIVGSNKAWYPDGKHDDGCATWGQCPHCQVIGLAHCGQHHLCSCQCTERKTVLAEAMVAGGRRWFEYCSFCGINMGLGTDTKVPHRHMASHTLAVAYNAARSARFEHGETPR